MQPKTDEDSHLLRFQLPNYHRRTADVGGICFLEGFRFLKASPKLNESPPASPETFEKLGPANHRRKYEINENVLFSAALVLVASSMCRPPKPYYLMVVDTPSRSESGSWTTPSLRKFALIRCTDTGFLF
jgi:hypothetical protein